jgi:hypothetical protein
MGSTCPICNQPIVGEDHRSQEDALPCAYCRHKMALMEHYGPKIAAELAEEASDEQSEVDATGTSGLLQTRPLPDLIRDDAGIRTRWMHWAFKVGFVVGFFCYAIYFAESYTTRVGQPPPLHDLPLLFVVCGFLGLLFGGLAFLVVGAILSIRSEKPFGEVLEQRLKRQGAEKQPDIQGTNPTPSPSGITPPDQGITEAPADPGPQLLLPPSDHIAARNEDIS